MGSNFPAIQRYITQIVRNSHIEIHDVRACYLLHTLMHGLRGLEKLLSDVQKNTEQKLTIHPDLNNQSFKLLCT